ncbi:hypothetical protein N9K77_01765 [bacterium]|nr:hypothetical protein [bacterium]
MLFQGMKELKEFCIPEDIFLLDEAMKACISMKNHFRINIGAIAPWKSWH